MKVDDPGDPQTVFGALLAALGQRRTLNIGSFTILSCDNVPRNCEAARRAVLGLAALVSRGYARLDRGDRRLSKPDGRLHHAHNVGPRAQAAG